MGKLGLHTEKSIWQRPAWVAIFAFTAAFAWGWAYPLIKLGFVEFGIASDQTGSNMLFAGSLSASSPLDAGASSKPSRPDAPRKLSYKEQRELEQLEKDIESLTAEKSDLESKMNGGLTDPAELQKVTTRFAEVSSELDTKETRWLELSV